MMPSETAIATSNKRRSERVVLTVRLALSIKGADGRVTSLEAKSQVVNVHGGMLVTQVEIVTGQEFVLTNPKTAVSKRCRALRTEKLEPAGMSVAFQFDEPAPKFWPVEFPPSDWAASNFDV